MFKQRRPIKYFQNILNSDVLLLSIQIEIAQKVANWRL